MSENTQGVIDKPPLSFEDYQRLSRAFNEVADLRSWQDLRINEWLKAQIAAKVRETR